MIADDTPLDVLRIHPQAVEGLEELGFLTVGDVRAYLAEGGKLGELNITRMGPKGLRALEVAAGRVQGAAA